MTGIGKKIAAGVLATLLLAGSGTAYYTKTESFMQGAGDTAAQAASEVLGVQVQIGEIEVPSLREVTIHNIALYDKQAECIARADEARVSFRLLAALQEPAEAVSEVEVKGLRAVIEQRADESWNVQDVAAGESSGKGFYGRIRTEDAEVTLKAQGREVVLSDVTGELDCAGWPAMEFKGRGNCRGAALAAQGTVTSERQFVHVEVQQAQLREFLPLLPEGLLPEEIQPEGGLVPEAQATVVYQGGVMSLTGSARLEDGRLQALGTEVEKITGTARFTDREILLDASAEAAGQGARAYGKVRLDTGMPFLDLVAESESFDPSAILKDVPYQGAAKFKAHITGAATDPRVEGEAQVASGAAYGVPFREAAARVLYEGGHLYAQDLKAKALGGSVSGEGEFEPGKLAFTAHLKAQGLNLSHLASALPGVPELAEVSGLVGCDIGVSGQGADLARLKSYGSVKLEQGSFKGLPLEHLAVSFLTDGDNVTVDYLSARMPGHSDLGLEGTITDGRKLDFKIYGGHIDLSLFAPFVPQAEPSGIADFKGEVHGDASNPQVQLEFSATRGRILKQPFDSVVFQATGSLDGLSIRDFSLMKDGRQTWYVDGTIGLTGEKRINLRADTVKVRMEDLAALVAPEQPITGNVDNTIRFTGTLDNPQAVGYIHFYRGSYMGVLLSGMDGDYYLENGVVRLQDFHIYSPMIDMDVNGKVTRSGDLDLETAVHDIDMKRIQHKLPYEVEGHGTFSGRIRGNLSAPLFHGILDAPALTMNGVELAKVHGQVDYAGQKLSFSKFGLHQGEGSYDLELSLDTVSHGLWGRVSVRQADVNSLCALLNLKNELVAGTLEADSQVSGTLENPQVIFDGRIDAGTVAGYAVEQMILEGHLADKVLHFDKLEGTQGEGAFSASGSAALYGGGPLAAKVSAQRLPLGLFARVAGLEADVTGQADLEANIAGFTDNPSADVHLLARDGGVEGSTFDNLTGVLHLKNGLLDVEQLQVQKQVGEKLYRASAKGIVPSKALHISDPAALNDYEQMRLEFSLDDADLSLLPALWQQVDWAMGPLQGSVLVTGTLAHPQFNGSVQLAGGSVKLKALELPFTDMAAQVDFNGTQMTVRDFSGKMGAGSYSGSGKLRLEGLTPVDYGFDFFARGLEIRSSFFKGPLEGELHLAEGEIYGHRLPKLSGLVNFHDCTVSVPSVPESDGELPNVIMDVQVDVGKKVHFYSSYLYDMYLSGAVHFGGTTRHPKMNGEVRVKNGGTVSYLKTPFKIHEGTAYFNQVDSFLPSLNFYADTMVGRTRIYLYLSGPLGASTLRLGSFPEHSQTEILQILTLRSDYNSGSGVSAGDILSLGLQMTVLSEIEAVMKRVIFLDTFNIVRGHAGSVFSTYVSGEKRDDEDDYSIRMGKNLNDKLQVTLTQEIGSKHRTGYGLHYDFNDRFGMTVETRGSETIVGLEARIAFW